MKEIKDNSCPNCGHNVINHIQNIKPEIIDLEKVIDGEYGIQARWKEVWICPCCKKKFYWLCEH